jgi:uncharacterized membrane protein (UPF0127 family)
MPTKTRMRAMNRIASLVVLVLIAAAGCQSDNAKTLPDDPAAHAGGDETGGSEAGGDEVGESSQSRDDAGDSNVPLGVGQSCATPKDCPSYLWCFDETCKIPPAVTGEHDANTPRLVFNGPEGAERAAFYLELAITPDEHEKGLMFRRDLPDDWGMLFIYPDEAPRSFWMQNTFISLDMVFIDAGGEVVNIVEEAVPLTRTPRRSTGPARYVLEIRGGLAAELGLEAGQQVELANIADEHKLQR